MAEDKTIVTKKTAPKAAAATVKKTAPKKTTEKVMSPSKAAAPTPQTSKGAAGGTKTKAVATSTSARQAPPPKEPAAAAPAARKSATTKATTDAGRGKKTSTEHEIREPGTITLALLAKASSEERLHMINEAAYYRAEKRRFAPGHEVEDWAEAEREIDALIANAKRLSGR
jgi:hypothetical protein